MIDSLLRQLQDPNPEARRRAIISLGKSKNPDALKPLAAVVVGDPEPELRELARKAGQYIRQQAQQQTRPHVSPFTVSLDEAEYDPEPEYLQVQPIVPEPEPEQEVLLEDQIDDLLALDEKGTTVTFTEPTQNNLVMRGRQFDIPRVDRERAKQYLDAAMSYSLTGDNAKALKNLTSALGLNPNLLNDPYFNNVATTVTGLDGDAAAQVIIDRNERQRFTETAQRAQKSKRVEEHLTTAEQATWTDVWFEVIIYSLIVIIGPVLAALVTVESARNLLGSFTEVSADLPEQLQNAQVLSEAFSLDSLLPIGIVSGISGVISLLFQTVLIHFSAGMMGGTGTWRHLIRLLLGFYNKWLPILFFILYITIAVTFASALSPIILCFVIVLFGLSFYISLKTASKIGEAYDFGTGKGCLSLLISLIIVGIINASISYILAQSLGTALNSIVTGGI
jgi:hypothetical protein